jgi:hypothetical protein
MALTGRTDAAFEVGIEAGAAGTTITIGDSTAPRCGGMH